MNPDMVDGGFNRLDKKDNENGGFCRWRPSVAATMVSAWPPIKVKWRIFRNFVPIKYNVFRSREDLITWVQIVARSQDVSNISVVLAFMHNEKMSNYRWTLTCMKLTINNSFCPCIIVTDRDLALMKAYEDVFPQKLKIGAVNHTCECLLARDVRITRRSGIVVGGVASSAKIDSGE
ncbi:hypothetical protein LXL04_035221 [Taraxacum kok-saghyz]